jgi:hypothetical protein
MTRRSRAMLSNPYTAWAEVAMKTGEMMLASAQVIGHRTGRMATAGPLPSARDQREFTLMAQEKVVAAQASAQAMGQYMMTMNMRVAMRAWQDSLKLGSHAVALAGSRTIGQTLERQTQLARSVAQSARSAAQLGQVGAELTQRALKPVHAKASANAKRLARR